MRIIRKCIRYVRWYLEKIKYDKARKKADELHLETNRQYWVIKVKNRYRVLTRPQIKVLQKDGIISQRLNYIKLSNISNYHTK